MQSKEGTEISSPFFIRYFDIYRANWKEYSIKINPEKYLINYDPFTKWHEKQNPLNWFIIHSYILCAVSLWCCLLPIVFIIELIIIVAMYKRRLQEIIFIDGNFGYLLIRTKILLVDRFRSGVKGSFYFTFTFRTKMITPMNLQID